MADKLALGKLGEQLAVQYLLKQGYKIIERNFRKRYGEIDIVAQDPSTRSGEVGETLVFVEVKTRYPNNFGSPEEAITPWKLKSLIKSAEYYKMLHPELPDLLRIDFVGVEFGEDGRVKEIKLIRNITF